MYDIKHSSCGKVAFRSVVKPKREDAVRAIDVRRLDGSTPEVGDAMECGACDCMGGTYTPVDGFADD
jgi:hypothetical protein